MNLKYILMASLFAGSIAFGSIPETAVFHPAAGKISAGDVKPYSCINADGTTLETRINPPEGYTRVEAEEGS